MTKKKYDKPLKIEASFEDALKAISKVPKKVVDRNIARADKKKSDKNKPSGES